MKKNSFTQKHALLFPSSLSLSLSFLLSYSLFLFRSLPFLSHLLVIPGEIELTFQERTRPVRACVTLRPYGRACLSDAHACSRIALALGAGASSTMTTRVSFA